MDVKSSSRNEIRVPPRHCIVPGTFFTVDWHSKTSPEYIHSFLSHAHSDHLMGIGSFRSPRVLHCTDITYRMLKIKYPKVVSAAQVHEYGSFFEIDGVVIHVLNANHTPGSAMFVFIMPDGKKIMHTGDFRAEPFIIQSASIFSPVDSIYCDCTFGTSNLDIPARDICVSFITDRIREGIAKGAISLIGTYTIGKEDLVYDVALATGQLVFAEQKRLSGLKSLIEAGWKDNDLFTDNPHESRVHLISIQDCSIENAAAYGKKYGFKTVISFQATGWAGKPFWQAPISELYDDIDVTLYKVPYSDHCNIPELCQFIKAMRPSKIIPITTQSKKDIAKLDKLFLPYIRKDQNKRFIEYYTSPPRLSQNKAINNSFELRN